MSASSPHSVADPVLVAGATGRTGRLIVERLLADGVPVRALVRDAAKAATLPAGTECVVGDLRRPETLADAVSGARAVIIATTGSGALDDSAELVDFLGTRSLAREAAEAGVDLVVDISSIYATRPEHYLDADPESLGWKARGEEAVRAAGVDYCIVRAGWLTDDGGGEPLAFSQGDVAEGHLSRADLADVCVGVLALGAARGKTFEVVAAHHGSGTALRNAVAALSADPSVLH